MRTKWIQQSFISILIAAFIASIAWTIASIRSNRIAEPQQEILLRIIPNYQIVSGKDLYAWPAGTVFEQGMAAYFYAAEPKVTVTPAVEISGLNYGLVSGTIDYTVNLQSVDDKSRVYWSYLLNETQPRPFTLSMQAAGATDQNTFTAPSIVIYVPSTYDIAAEIYEELMFQAGSLQLVITADVHLSGNINGIDIERTIVHKLPLTLYQFSFSIPKTEDAITTVNLVGPQKQTPQYSLIDIARINFIPLLVNLILFVLIVVLLLTQRAKPNIDKEHKRFKEWITDGIVEIRDKFIINILTLEGLVDLAIDLDRRVIFDSRVSKYYVLTEDIVYVYDSGRKYDGIESRQQLGRLLLQQGLIKPEQLEIGLYHQKKTGTKLGESLIALGFIDASTLYSTLAAQQKLDYFELDPDSDILDKSWLEKMSIHVARALVTIPLGKRADGKLVTACGDISREGIRETLEEILNTEIHLVSARPSAIYAVLKRLESFEQEKRRAISGQQEQYGHITKNEKEQFTASYYRGYINYRILLTESALVDPSIFNQVPDQESLPLWLMNKNIITGETVSLLIGLDRAIQSMTWEKRQQKQVPGLVDLLLHSNFVTGETAEWINRELPIQGIPIEKLLCDNYLTSENTIKTATILLTSIQRILANTAS